MISAIVTFLLFASASATCTPATLLSSGCSLKGPSGVSIEYALHESTVDFSVKAPAAGFVALSIVKNGQTSQIPGDAVFGFSNGTIQKWQVNGPSFKDWLPSGVPLTNSKVTVTDGLHVSFTRRFDSGRFHINKTAVSFDVYYGMNFSDVSAAGSRVVANLVTGEPAASSTSSPPTSSPPTSSPSPERAHSSAESYVLNNVLLALLSMFPFVVAIA